LTWVPFVLRVFDAELIVHTDAQPAMRASQCGIDDEIGGRPADCHRAWRQP
jgi:hypothetical protein